MDVPQSDLSDLAVAFVTATSCDQARAYVSNKPDSPDFETCEFTGNYIGWTEVEAVEVVPPGGGYPASATVTLHGTDAQGNASHPMEVYMAPESGTGPWMITNANA